MKLKKITAVIGIAALSVGLLAGCGSSSQPAQTSAKSSAQAESSAAAEKGASDKTITIGASPSPHEEILEHFAEAFEKDGYTLDVVSFTDYVQPNKALAEGELDANYFQHKPFLDNFNEENGTDLVSAGAIHYEPMGIFSNKLDSLDAIKDGAKVAVPNDTSNEARALLLLQENGLITLADGADLNATVADIAENPHNLDIVELEAAQIPRSLDDVDFAVINGNYALPAGLDLQNALAMEEADSLAAKTYANIIAVRSEDADSEKTKELIKVLTSDEARQYIEENYNGAVLPAAK